MHARSFGRRKLGGQDDAEMEEDNASRYGNTRRVTVFPVTTPKSETWWSTLCSVLSKHGWVKIPT